MAHFLTEWKSPELCLFIFVNLTIAVFSLTPGLIRYNNLHTICNYLTGAAYSYQDPYFFFHVTSIRGSHEKQQ